MARTSPAAGVAVLDSLAGYEMAAAVRRLAVPLRAINGDLYPTDVVGVHRVKPDFDAVIMAHVGHYPMLERPEAFNRHLSEVISRLEDRQRRRTQAIANKKARTALAVRAELCTLLGINPTQSS